VRLFGALRPAIVDPDTADSIQVDLEGLAVDQDILRAEAQVDEILGMDLSEGITKMDQYRIEKPPGGMPLEPS